MLASERRLITDGETVHSLTKKCELSGRPVKIYVIDPKQFQARLDKFVTSGKKEQKAQVQNETQVAYSHHQQPQVQVHQTSTVRELPVSLPVPIPIAPKDGNVNGTNLPATALLLPTTTTLLPLPTIFPVSLSLPMSVPLVKMASSGSSGPILANGNANGAQKKSGTASNHSKKKKKVKKATADLSSKRASINDKAEEAEAVFLLKEATTRTGRKVSNKSVAAAKTTSDGSTSSKSQSLTQTQTSTPAPPVVNKPKKRDPPEKFRCLTCNRFYLGNLKFNQHFDKFPNHVKADPNKNKRENKESSADAIPIIPNGSFNGVTVSNVAEKGESLNPETLSDNCSSPKLLPSFTATSTSSSPSFGARNGRPNGGEEEGQGQYFMNFKTISSEFRIPGDLNSCSQQSFNSLENLLTEGDDKDNSKSPTGDRSASSETFFSERVRSPRNPPHPPITITLDDESRDTCEVLQEGRNGTRKAHSSGNSSSANQAHHDAGSGGSVQKRKSIWEFVKEQIRLCGINQTCGEISDMAEKLSKIARDKFYPVQEDELERLGSASPTIHVDTPFISHLLDLPLGTYVFKEDGGIRKVVPPPTPVSTELSLTNGVEVDVDKFLSPDIDLISLPHLTNLDFNSLCNN